MQFWGCLVVAVSLIGCGTDGQTVSATLTDHPDTLTASGSDRLFDLKVTKSDKDYPLDKLLLTFNPAGGTALALDFKHAVDANSDGKLGKGDTLTGVEPGADVLGAAQVGTEFKIELMEELGASLVNELWSGNWTAK